MVNIHHGKKAFFLERTKYSYYLDGGVFFKVKNF